MKNAEQGRGESIDITNAEERGIWGALLLWVLRGATIAFVVLLALLLYADLFNSVDAFAKKIGYQNENELSAGGHFTRDLALALLALGGIGMAAWRNREMSRQADAALDQAKAALDQAGIAVGKIKSENDRIAGERFLDAGKMLAQNNEKGEPIIAARVDGIYILQPLANNYVSEYAAQVVRRLVAYVKENVQLTKIPYKNTDMDSENEYVEYMCFLGKDVKAAFEVLAQLLNARDKSPEKKIDLSDNDLDFFDCDFSRLFLNYKQVNGLWHYGWQGSDLRGSDLRGANFRGGRMHGAQLQGANLCGANLEGARLHNADLRGARLGMGNTNKKFELTNLQGANLRGANLRGADLRGAMFSGVCADFAADLSYADLNGAKLQDTDLREANLSGVKDLPGLSLNQIWHSNQSELGEVISIETPSNRVWDLEPYWDCPYALAGVLRNYTIIYKSKDSASSSNELLKAAHKLLKDDQLPSEFSENWREWLNKVDSELGTHPNFREGKSLFSYSWPIEFGKGRAAGTLAFAERAIRANA